MKVSELIAELEKLDKDKLELQTACRDEEGFTFDVVGPVEYDPDFGVMIGVREAN